MLLVNKKFNSVEKQISTNTISIDKNIELLAVALDEVIFVVVYASPQNQIDFKEFETIMFIGSKILLGGDLNAKHKAWGNHNNNRAGNTLLKFLIGNKNRNCEIKYSDEPTRFDVNRTNGSIIDIFITKNIKSSKPITLNELTSDHIPVLMFISLMRQNNNDHNKNKLNFNKTKWIKYRKVLNDKWTIIKKFHSKESIDETIAKLTSSIRTSLISSTPKWKENNCFQRMNTIITELIKKRNKIRSSFQKNGCNHCKKKI